MTERLPPRIHIINWLIYRSGLPPIEKRVALALAGHTNDKHRIYAPPFEIARKAGLSFDNFAVALHALADREIVTQVGSEFVWSRSFIRQMNVGAAA